MTRNPQLEDGFRVGAVLRLPNALTLAAKLGPVICAPLRSALSLTATQPLPVELTVIALVVSFIV